MRSLRRHTLAATDDKVLPRPSEPTADHVLSLLLAAEPSNHLRRVQVQQLDDALAETDERMLGVGADGQRRDVALHRQAVLLGVRLKVVDV